MTVALHFAQVMVGAGILAKTEAVATRVDALAVAVSPDVLVKNVS